MAVVVGEVALLDVAFVVSEAVVAALVAARDCY